MNGELNAFRDTLFPKSLTSVSNYFNRPQESLRMVLHPYFRSNYGFSNADLFRIGFRFKTCKHPYHRTMDHSWKSGS